MDGVQDAIRDVIREGALSDAINATKEGIRQEITPILKRVQGVEVHAHVNTAKLDQWLADLENDIVKAGGLDLVQEGLMEVQQKMATIWKTVYGLEVAKGEEAVFFALFCLFTDSGSRRSVALLRVEPTLPRDISRWNHNNKH